MTTARHTFTQFITSLQESLQLQEEMARAKLTEKLYGKYQRDARDVRYRGIRHGERYDSRSPRRYAEQNYRPSLSRSLSIERCLGSSRRPGHRQTLARVQRSDCGHKARRLSFGCGSPDHILSDNKCTPSLQSIEMHIIHSMNCSDESAGSIAEQTFIV